MSTTRMDVEEEPGLGLGLGLGPELAPAPEPGSGPGLSPALGLSVICSRSTEALPPQGEVVSPPVAYWTKNHATDTDSAHDHDAINTTTATAATGAVTFNGTTGVGLTAVPLPATTDDAVDIADAFALIEKCIANNNLSDTTNTNTNSATTTTTTTTTANTTIATTTAITMNGFATAAGGNNNGNTNNNDAPRDLLEVGSTHINLASCLLACLPLLACLLACSCSKSSRPPPPPPHFPRPQVLERVRACRYPSSTPFLVDLALVRDAVWARVQHAKRRGTGLALVRTNTRASDIRTGSRASGTETRASGIETRASGIEPRASTEPMMHAIDTVIDSINMFLAGKGGER